MKLDFRQRLLTTTLLVGAASLASPAFAQDGQSTVPDQNQATNPGGAPATGDVAASPTPTVSATGEPVQQAQDIVVTGTRIPQPNLESAAPVTVVSNQDIKLSGLTRIDDVLNQLPSAAASQGPGLPNPATGTAEIDLRYLGAKRTLSLINGRRITPGDPNSSSQAGDINVIPAFMVKRVEVLTGGASSVYGADAVAGVVNFIMDTDFTGLRLDGQISGYQHDNDCPSIGGGNTVCDELDRNINVLHRSGYAYPSGSGWDGKSIDLNAGFGINFDDGRGHAMAYFGYRKQNAVTQDARDYSACTLNRGGVYGVSCGGSQTSGVGTFYLFDNSSNSTFFQRGPNGTVIGGDTRFNYAPYNHWIRPDERYVGGAFADYEITPAIKPYMEFMFMDDQTQAQIAPSGDFGSTFTINCDNPYIQNATALICQPGNLINTFIGNFAVATSAGYNPDPLNPAITFFDARGNQYNNAYFQILRRNVEGGARQNNLYHTTYRGVIGTRGDLSNAFSYDAYYQYGKTNYSQVYKNEFSQARLVKALNAVNVDSNGIVVPVGTPDSNIVCRSVLDGTDPNCVPYDILGTPSAAAINYLNVYGVIHGQTSEQVANVNFTGQLGELGMQTPWANDGIGINVGWEYRHEQLALDPDQLFQQNDLTGQGGATLPVHGKFHVNELFGEIQIPIVQHNFIDELSLSGGYRHSKYKNAGNGFSNSYSTDTYKLSAEFAPIADVRFRGSYNRAVRAPNIVELFGTVQVGLDGSTDPCAGHAIDAAAEPGCIAQGLHDGQRTPLNPAEQYNGLLGGNPNLRPEKATTKTLGVVLQPRFLPRFAFTVDYWNIKLDGAIQGFGADTILQDCVDNTTDPNNPAPSCDLIHRDPSGSIWLSPNGYVIDTPTNVGRIKTDGFDFTSAYSHRFGGLGNLGLSFLGTWLKHYKVNNGVAPTYDCAGYYGTVCSGNTVASSSAMPKWRHKVRATLQMPFGLGISAQWRMVGKVAFEANSDDVALAGSAAARGQLNSHVKAQHYFDLAATYTLFDMVNLRAGVNNIFDKSPPIIPTGSGSCPSAACTGNTYPQTWDYLGRFLYAGATVDFKHRPTPIAPPPVIAPPPPPPAAPATITCPDGLVILANQACPTLPPPPPPPAPAPERGQ